jgi:hypothetical protein
MIELKEEIDKSTIKIKDFTQQLIEQLKRNLAKIEENSVMPLTKRNYSHL